MGDYWIRHLPPQQTDTFAEGIDKGIMSVLKTCVGVDPSSWNDIALERLRLPIRYKGCGLRQLIDRRHAQYIGAAIASLPQLIDKTDEHGNVSRGRFNLPSIVQMLGADSFSPENEEPWKHLFETKPDSSIARGIDTAWSHLTHNFQNVKSHEINTEKFLLEQTLYKAGRYGDGTLPKSATHATTMELESHRALHLGKQIKSNLPRTDYGRQAFEAWTSTSACFLMSPPDGIGYIPDADMQMAITTYLGLPCPVMAPMVGRFFGKNGSVLDEFGANLAAAPLPGGGHRHLHNRLVSLMMEMMKTGGIQSVPEAKNFLIGKVGGAPIQRYVQHIAEQRDVRHSPFCIIPDLHALNFPARNGTINDSGAIRAAEAIFEVKTMTACRTRYAHNNDNILPANRRAKDVRREYVRKFKKMDEKFDWETANGTPRAFTQAQTRFICNGIIPLVGGFWAEVNEDFDKTIRLLARTAAATQEATLISPLSYTDRKGGAFPIMLQQFKRAIGVAIVRGNAQLRRGRLHYVRPTKEEAYHAADSHHSNNKWTGSGKNGWFKGNDDDGYSAFEQFKNGQDFYVH